MALGSNSDSVKHLSLLQNVQTGSGDPPSGYRLPFSVVKLPGSDVDHTPLSSTEVKNSWSHTSTPAIYLHGVHRDNNHRQLRRSKEALPITSQSFVLVSYIKHSEHAKLYTYYSLR